ncbi:sulfite exporter TauE/SafE family protein [Pectobacterium carotovorum]|uniref:sulfite exporter TauE/SafE family protein n=1 Tax=Pectobacterium TaxID=122277 RepID=UPI0029D7DBFE|nr:sulfite exporter TauE/SafE family protein [Pectobacterium carotovorum]MDX6916318.1 sulfite exporter TauE/SafE family protein [Pectobacterium carotovorum]
MIITWGLGASLALLAACTSAIAATTGVGGVLLLSALYMLLPDPRLVIPMHACVSLVSNATRLIAYWRFIDVGIWARYMIGAMPGVAVSTFILYRLFSDYDAISPYFMIIIGIVVWWSTYSGSKRSEVDRSPAVNFYAVGAFSAPVSMLFGANGAVLAPYFLKTDIGRQRIVATSTACQFSLHLIKIPAIYTIIYGLLSGENSSVEYDSVVLSVFSMVTASILGTLLGGKLLENMNETKFNIIYRTAMYLISSKIFIFDGLLKTPFFH